MADNLEQDIKKARADVEAIEDERPAKEYTQDEAWKVAKTALNLLLEKENILLRRQEGGTGVQAGGAAAGGAGRGLSSKELYWARRPFYSPTIAMELGLRTPWEQLGLYCTAGISLLGCIKYVNKTRALFKAVATADPTAQKNIMARYWLAPHQLENAKAWATIFSAQGMACLSAPVLWTAWRTSNSESARHRNTATTT